MKLELFKKWRFVTIFSFLAIGICSIFLVAPVSAQTNNFEKLFYIVDGKAGLESFKNNVKSIDVIAPQSYRITVNLKTFGFVPAGIIKVATENNIKIMPLVTNADFSQAIIHKMLVAPPATQNRIINFFISEAQKNNFIGWQFDFEHINYKDRELYSKFVEKTSVAFKKKKLILSIAAVMRTDDKITDFYKNWSGAFDYERLAKSVDFISVMTYDDPNSKGPVASIPYITAVTEYLKVKKVPNEKISLGVPFYYWGWSEASKKKVNLGGGFPQLQYLRDNFKTVEGFDEGLQASFLKYSFNNKKYIVWHDDQKSMASKLDLMEKNGYRGFSAWVLGKENPEVWRAIDSI